MSEMLCKQVAEELRLSGLNAVCWDSGGGVFGIGVAPGGTPPDELRFFFGTAGEFWAGEVFDDDGEVADSAITDVPSDSDEPLLVAAGILRALSDRAMSRWESATQRS